VAIPDPGTWSAGLVTTSMMNTRLRDVENWLLNPPHVHCFRSTTKTGTANGSFVLHDLDSELYDWSVSAMHDNATNNSRLTAPEAGIYYIAGHIRFAANAGGARGILIRKNAAGNPVSGTAVIERYELPSSGNLGFVHWAGDFPMSAGDYVEMWTYQNSGGTLDVLPGPHVTYLSIRWASKQ
jgi:hypothetical protein